MEKTFEDSLNDLEKIVAQLEDGDLPLEKSLELFEAGVKLSRECKERLTQAERRIEILMKDANGNMTATELDLRDDGGITDASSPKRIVFGDDDDTPF